MKNKLKLLIAVFIFTFIFLNYLSRFQGPATGYWDTYITAPALFIVNHPIKFVSKEGNNLYNYDLPGKLPQNLVGKNTYGVISKDQRIGTGILFSPWFLFFKLFGFRALFAISGLIIAVFTFMIIRLFSNKFLIAIFAALAASMNPYMISLNLLNPNIIGLMFISILIYLILSGAANWFLIGLVYGVFGGIRNEGVLFLPAILYHLFFTSERKSKDTILFLFGTIIAISPILYWNNYAFGNIFMHPTQFKGLEGFRPTFEHQFLFLKFNFNGMFNWPLYEKIVRTPFFAFPVFLLLPLILINSFGVILSALAINGAFRVLKDNRQLFIFLALWFLPMYCLLSVMENWSMLKTTFILLCMTPIIITMCFGLKELLNRISSREYLIRTLCLIVIIWSSIRLLALADFQADPRWYVRFPRVLEKGEISFIGDDLRTAPENPADVLTQKNELTRASFIPRFPRQRIDIGSLKSKIRNEIYQDNLTIVDFWKYIYEH